MCTSPKNPPITAVNKQHSLSANGGSATIRRKATNDKRHATPWDDSREQRGACGFEGCARPLEGLGDGFERFFDGFLHLRYFVVGEQRLEALYRK